MTYHNPRIPEGINSGRQTPLRDLVVLGAGALGLGFGLLVTLMLIGSWLAPLIPFSWERDLASAINAQDLAGETVPSPRLQVIVDDLANAAGLPDDMILTVHIMDSDMVNAFATMGGHIVVTRGLLEALPSENALAWVLSHEIAHVENRDVISSLGANAFFALGAMVLLGDADVLDELILGGGGLANLHFSREREKAADLEGLTTLVAHYGHAGGYAEALGTLKTYAVLQELSPVFFSSHPDLDDRIKTLDREVDRRGWRMETTEPASDWSS